MNLPKLTPESKKRVEAVLARAAENIEFRNRLLNDPQAALRDSDLDEHEKASFLGMRRVALEEWGVDVRRFRAFLRDNGNKISPVQ